MKLDCDLKIALVLFVCLAVAPVLAQSQTNVTSNDFTVDIVNLEDGIPSFVEDAYVLPDGYFEAQGIVNWGDADRDHWWEYRVQLAAGLSNKWQGTVGMFVNDNGIDSTGDGDVYLKFMHQFVDRERDAALFGVQLNLPTGQDYARLDRSFPPYVFVVNERQNSVDVELMGVYTRILDAERKKRLHVEVKEKFIRSAPEGSADTQLSLGVGFDKLIRDDTLAIASLCWFEGPTPCDYDSSVLHLGLRHKESAHFLWGAGLKIGLDWADANWGLVWGAQYSL